MAHRSATNRGIDIRCYPSRVIVNAVVTLVCLNIVFFKSFVFTKISYSFTLVPKKNCWLENCQLIHMQSVRRNLPPQSLLELFRRIMIDGSPSSYIINKVTRPKFAKGASEFYYCPRKTICAALLQLLPSHHVFDCNCFTLIINMTTLISTLMLLCI